MSKCPKGYFSCPLDTCDFTSESVQKMAAHVVSQHAYSEHATKSAREIEDFKKERAEREQRTVLENEIKKAARAEAEKLRDQEAVRQILAEQEKLEKQTVQEEKEKRALEILKDLQESMNRKERNILSSLGLGSAGHALTDQGDQHDYGGNRRDDGRREWNRQDDRGHQDRGYDRRDGENDNRGREERREDQGNNEGGRDKRDNWDRGQNGDKNGDKSDRHSRKRADEDQQPRKYGGGSGGGGPPSDNGGDDYWDEKEKKWKANRQAIIKLNFHWDDYVKPACLLDNPPETMTYFAEKEALSRHDIKNAGGVYGRHPNQPQQAMLVAPIFKKSYLKVFKELGLQNVPTTEFMAWY